MAARSLGKYLENEQSPVIDRQLQMPLQVALLRRAQSLVEQNLCSANLLRQHFDFVSFTAANKQGGVWCPALAGDTLNRLQARCLGQQTKLFKAVIKIGQAQINPDQNSQRLTAAGEVVGTQLAGLSSESAAAKFTARPGTMVEMACLYTIWVTVLRSRTTY